MGFLTGGFYIRGHRFVPVAISNYNRIDQGRNCPCQHESWEKEIRSTFRSPHSHGLWGLATGSKLSSTGGRRDQEDAQLGLGIRRVAGEVRPCRARRRSDPCLLPKCPRFRLHEKNPVTATCKVCCVQSLLMRSKYGTHITAFRSTSGVVS